MASRTTDTPHNVRELRNYVGGSFVDGTRTFDNITPVDGTLLARVHEADQATVDRAVLAARETYEKVWGRMPVEGRAKLLYAVADGIEKRFDEFVAAESADTGKPRSLSSHLDIPRGAANFRIFADLIKSVGTECYPMDTPDGKGALNYTIRQPHGVVGVISPWNLPLLLSTWKIAPAMASGNCVILKPSEETPTTATLLAEVMHEVGIPPGAFNVVHGFGPNSAGEFIARHRGIDALTFTGETRTGSEIMRSASANVKALSFELGGKNPAIVFADCDFDAAIDGTTRSVFANCGQVCLSSERVYVERPIFDRFVAALKARAETMKIGRPEDASTQMGPLISREHRDKVLSYYTLAKAEGATVVTGGGAPRFGDERDGGAYVDPTIFTGLSEASRVQKEEIFGPVCHITPFDREEDAVRMANDTDYGLAAVIWTTNLTRAHRVSQQVLAGITWVNCWFLRDLRTPFGGMKLSGIGREGGQHALNFYSEQRNICIKL
ncbi:MAG: 2-hydroxymuconic semialdehyde dehydrogenase [Alphaproteobacteria bacterium]|nr:2-hydroxymuconic semialdehyde dehydrogenase [Alphaproteobacteria bacterium]